MRLITRGGYGWTKRYPWIVEPARKNRAKQFVIDGEAGVLGVCIADFDALHWRAGMPTAFPYFGHLLIAMLSPEAKGSVIHQRSGIAECD